MKKFLLIIFAVHIILTVNTFAEEEYSNNADMNYGYNEIFDEIPKQEEETSASYDNISTSYDESFDECKNVEYGEEYSDEPEPQTDIERAAVSVFINNERIKFDVPPAIIISDRTLVPIRAIAEGLDCKVQWYSQTQTVEILK